MPWETPGVTVLTDGRVISPAADGSLVERLLTADGLARIRDRIDRQLLAHPGQYAPTPRPDVEIPGHGGFAYRFTLPGTSGIYEVWATPPFDPDLYLPDPAVDELVGLAEEMLSLAAIPAASWASSRPAASVPRWFALRVVASPDPDAGARPQIEEAWPLEKSVDTFGESEPSTGPVTRRCALLTPEEAEATLALFEAGLADPSLESGYLRASYRGRWANWLRGLSEPRGIQQSFAVPDDELIPPSFDQHTVVLLVRPADAPALDEAELDRLQVEHLTYLRDQGRRGVLIANGPLDEQSDERLRGISIYALPPDEARRVAEADPMVRAGRLAVEVMRWSTAAGAIAFPGGPWPTRG